MSYLEVQTVEYGGVMRPIFGKLSTFADKMGGMGPPGALNPLETQ